MPQQEFNIKSFSVNPGEFLSFDIDHATFEEDLIYGITTPYTSDERGFGNLYEKPSLSWLNISDDGVLSGNVPDDFIEGNLSVWAADASQYFVDQSIAEYFRTDEFKIVSKYYVDDDDEAKIPGIHFNVGFEEPLLINSTAEEKNHHITNISIGAETIVFPDGDADSVDSYNAIKGTRGVDISGTRFDDFIDLSGYQENEFSGEWWEIADLNLTAGNDLVIAPDIKIDGHYVGILDAKNYYNEWGHFNFDLNYDGLLFEFQEEDTVKISDDGNGHYSEFRNIHKIETSYLGDDTVIGNASANSFSSQGGTDTFYGGEGSDRFQIRFKDRGNSIEKKLIIADYESGEEISIRRFLEYNELIESIEFNNDTELDTTFLSISGFDDLIEVHGQWSISSPSFRASSDSQEAYFSLKPIYPPYDPSDIDLDSYQQTQLGSDKDIFFGEDENDYISTGGGDDLIYSGAGDDLIRVEGEGSVQVDTGEGSDHVSVGAGFAGTLLVKNGAGFNTLKIDQTIKNGGVSTSPYYSGNSDENGFEYTLADNSIITIENQFVFNEQTAQYEVADTGFQYFEYDGWKGFAEEFSGYNWRGLTGTQGDDLLKVHDHDDENIVNFLSGRDGNDELILAGGVNQAWGGEGDDTFKVMATDQRTIIIADRSAPPYYSGDFNGDELPEVFSRNVSFADVVEIDWSYTDSVIENVAHGYRITNEALDAVVEVYDVEILKFADGEGGWDTRYLTEGAPVGKDNWMFGNAGKDIAYGDGSDIRFVLGNGTAPDGAALSDNGTSDILQVYATVTQTETVTQWLHPERDDKTSPVEKAGWRKVIEEKVIGSEESLIWEGDRTSVDAFNFSDGVSINVINVADKGWDDSEIYSTVGTDGVDLIFGNDSDNLIDGKGGDDIIFGGDGDDVIIGGEGDDVLVGGAGDDIIRGDMVDDMDAAKAYFADLEGFDTDTLSIETSTVVEGNDTILGGDGIDDIESGEGKNLVASGRADMDGDGEADLDVIKEHMTAHKDIFDDDDWI